MVQELSESPELATAESSATLRQVLRRLLTRPAVVQLPAHSRAEHPVFTQAQVQAIYDAAFYWGVEAVRVEADWRAQVNSGVSAFFMQRLQSRLDQAEQAVRSEVLDALRCNELNWQERHVVTEVVSRAHYWVQWRVRGLRGGYGECSEVAARAAWALREYLLALEQQELNAEPKL